MSEVEKLSELDSIKKHLKITCNYEDSEIKDMIEDGKTVINSICGSSDFSVGGEAYTVLKAYCRYGRSGSTAMFEENYKRQLLRLQIQNGLKKFRGDV